MFDKSMFCGFAFINSANHKETVAKLEKQLDLNSANHQEIIAKLEEQLDLNSANHQETIAKLEEQLDANQRMMQHHEQVLEANKTEMYQELNMIVSCFSFVLLHFSLYYFLLSVVDLILALS